MVFGEREGSVGPGSGGFRYGLEGQGSVFGSHSDDVNLR